VLERTEVRRVVGLAAKALAAASGKIQGVLDRTTPVEAHEITESDAD
jgi:hypothetical protein